MDKQMIKYVSILVGLVVLLIIFLLIKNSITGGIKYSYQEIEQKMISATKDRVEDKLKEGQNILPDAIGGSSTFPASVLVSEGYLNDLSTYAKDDVICSGEVVVYNAGNGNYDYVPYLKCGTAYETTKLVSQVLKDNDYGIIQGSGLYVRKNGVFVTNENDLGGSADSVEYVFRGDNVNNYVKIDENIWRIVAIDDAENMLLILESNSQKTYAWDSKYNDDVKKYQGVNTYFENGLESNIYNVVNDFYNGNVTLVNKEKYSSKIKNILTPMTVCIGKRSEQDSSIDGSTECKTVLEDEYMSILPAYYFMSASLDPACTSITSKNCGNYNYMTKFDDYWWLLTSNSDNTTDAYLVTNKYVESNICSTKAYIKPIIKLGTRAVYAEGNGTLENPYQINYFTE